jgi:hypothetical protein
MDKPFRRLTDVEFRQLSPTEKHAYMKQAEAMRDAEFARFARPRKPQPSPANGRGRRD